MPAGLGKWINCLRRRRGRGRAPKAPVAPAAPAPPSHRKPNNRTTEQPNRPSPPSPSRVEPAYSGRKRPPMHPTRLRCCCSTCSQFCALYLTCAAAAAPHQRGPLRHLRAALGAAASFAHAWRRASPSHVLCAALPCTGRAHDLIAISHALAPSACTCTSRVNTRAELTHHTTPSSATHQLTTSTAQLLSPGYTSSQDTT